MILGCYYQRQSKILRDDPAIRAGLVNVASGFSRNDFQNVVLEVANEYPHNGFVHGVIRDANGQAGLIRLVKETSPELLVTASGYGDGKIHAAVARGLRLSHATLERHEGRRYPGSRGRAEEIRQADRL